MNWLDNYNIAIANICRKHKVKSLYVFGSVLTTSFSSKSDIDFVVDFSPIPITEYADNYFDFKFSLQDILKHEIDLLEEKAIKNPYFKESIEVSKKLVYGY
jgi:uncharacterized protein